MTDSVQTTQNISTRNAVIFDVQLVY